MTHKKRDTAPAESPAVATQRGQMHVEPFEHDRYFVTGRSGTQHLVDLDHEGKPACSCHRFNENTHYKGQNCHHIKAAYQYAQRVGRYLYDQNKQYRETATMIPKDQWPLTNRQPERIEVWRSRDFLVQVFQEEGCIRFSVNRTEIDSNGGWRDGITWDDIQKVKRMIGRDGMWGTELYPPQNQVVNVANIRHIWLFDKAPGYAWINTLGDAQNERQQTGGEPTTLPAGKPSPDLQTGARLKNKFTFFLPNYRSAVFSQLSEAITPETKKGKI